MDAGEMHTGFKWGDLMETDYLKDLGFDGSIILKLIFEKWKGARIGLTWLRAGRNGGLF
jgi:hypothetical protein